MLVLNQMKKHGLYMVRTGCLTYNHERFILDTMNGFVLQKTTFPVVYTVVDDASTDKTPEVLRQFMNAYFDLHEADVAYEKDTEYGHVTFARHKTNKNCYFAIIYLRENHFSQKKSKAIYLTEWMDTKYVALCEGDDYWTDPLKLQKQVDFLETHEDYSMCFHKVEVITELDEKPMFDHLEERDYSNRQIFDRWTVPTCSVMFRNDYPFETHPSVFYGDIFMFLQLAERGKLHCLGFVGGVYRRHEDGLTHDDSSQTCVRLFHQYKYMQKRFPELSDISIRNQEQQLEGIIYAPYFSGIWKYRFRYMFRHPNLLFSSFLTTTLLSYTQIKNYKFWKKRSQ